MCFLTNVEISPRSLSRPIILHDNIKVSVTLPGVQHERQVFGDFFFLSLAQLKSIHQDKKPLQIVLTESYNSSFF